VDMKLLSLYVGPDQVMPVASMLAAAMGFLLVFWTKLVGIIRKILHLAPPPSPPETAPPATVQPVDKPKEK
jgi:hypothetical protein